MSVGGTPVGSLFNPQAPADVKNISFSSKIIFFINVPPCYVNNYYYYSTGNEYTWKDKLLMSGSCGFT